MGIWGPFDIHGKNAIVTGSAMGIGLGIAARFLESGGKVLMVDVNPHAVNTAVDRLGGEGRVIPFVADVGDDQAPERIVQRCLREFGSVDILVNDAGIFPSVPILQMKAEDYDRVQRINVRGLVFLSQAVGNQMVKQGTGGSIINIASVDSLHPSMVGLGAYDTSKGAVWSFTKSFALEMAPHGVRVNAIAPGMIHTEGTTRPLEKSGVTPAQMAEMTQKMVQAKVPLKRMGMPDDIALAAVYFASSASAYATGSLLVVDGGMLLT